MKPAEFKAQRQKLGLTQAKLAEILGVKANTVARWEQGVLKIAPITALALAHLSCRPKRGS